MKLAQHIDKIRELIERAYNNRLGRMGIAQGSISPAENIPAEYRADRQRMEKILATMTSETGKAEEGYEKLVEELTFTLFNRIAALKVMEAHTLIPEVITRREQQGGRSFSHSLWLEQHPEARNSDEEGLLPFFEEKLQELSAGIPLFSPQHPFHLLPTSIELLAIIDAFNAIEKDADVGADIWQSDDILGWLYESYNNYKKDTHKASGSKTEYNKVSIQSQVYTPRWVVQFLVDNSLGKLYLETFPDSNIKEKYKIAYAPAKRTREIKPLHEIKVIDPATGSGNFLLYAFDLFYDLYLDQIENYGADYDEDEIPKLIIENNLHGIDIDDRAVQLAQLGLYIKAKRKKRSIKIKRFNVVSSDFFLPDYEQVKHLFENGEKLKPELEKIVIDLWSDLQKAYKFGSLLRLQEKFSLQLHGLVKEEQGLNINLFTEQNLQSYEAFRQNFFGNLQKAIEHNKTKEGLNFLNTKTADAITFLRLLTQKYDVAVANPPYTDSSDFGPELKKFVEANYKKPHKFNTNLYAVFIKRNMELLDVDGKIGMIHPLTFMYIKSFEDVRKEILNHYHISILVEFGMGGLFPQNIFVDPAFYVLESNKLNEEKTIFISLDQYSNTFNQTRKKLFLSEAIDDFIANKPNKHLFLLDQEKLKIIDSWPFIYWISDAFREKFRGEVLEKYYHIAQGLITGNNERFLRFNWEIIITKELDNNFSFDFKWVKYAKGGPFNKWYGNLWLVVNWERSGEEIKNYFDSSGKLKSRPQNEKFYFEEGVTFSTTGSKGSTFRYLPKNSIFDGKGSSIFLKEKKDDIRYEFLLGLLNSKLSFYIVNCLNPTVETTIGDIKRIPFVRPTENIEKILSNLAQQNIAIKKQLCTYSLIEINFEQSPLTAFPGNSLQERALAYLNYENYELTKVLVNEAIIDELIYQVYELSPEDREQVEAKMGKSIGSLPVLPEALEAFKQKIEQENSPTKETVLQHLNALPTAEFEDEKIREIKEGFATLYQSNNDLEEFCKRHQVNPINVWYWFKEARILPSGRAKDMALEFLADTIRALLQQDDDGIIPLVGLPGEDALSQRLEHYCLQNGFTQAQFLQLDQLLGRPLNEYLEHHFFADLGDLLNVFRYLPKTPFIWHLSSGKYQGLELYTLIYKWNRDSLYKIKSKYIHDRKNNLEYRLLQLQDVNTAQAQNEKETIHFQLDEIEKFTKKIDELIAQGYDPKLDDGVGKNIAPLQAKGLLRAEVLKSGGKNSQLEKYLNADW
ncbi:BREX-1 system adenine-specific DNA-methyltransferase PglX [Tenuifilum thalassicum]|uniref:site-specific DNA-methyltransferase (adenine-specific) n=1 Tax=Tenuifilum thalassicum TaxID=2590900 RepID=A0A7D4BEV2_9BACT|nr:BREX-1 system adenine-specific DNA-methyltransferase PglX [Tenuifilum thalassicum]QKG81083.1 BREX-1 system adenine-specific DNA-methyltransferase PglX [Tenuifilum thalassicum]